MAFVATPAYMRSVKWSIITIFATIKTIAQLTRASMADANSRLSKTALSVKRNIVKELARKDTVCARRRHRRPSVFRTRIAYHQRQTTQVLLRKTSAKS